MPGYVAFILVVFILDDITVPQEWPHERINGGIRTWRGIKENFRLNSMCEIFSCFRILPFDLHTHLDERNVNKFFIS